MKRAVAERYWTIAVGWVGFAMFVGGVFESLVTLFWIGKDIVEMNAFRMKFSIAGLVLSMANSNLRKMAIGIGQKILNKINHKK